MVIVTHEGVLEHEGRRIGWMLHGPEDGRVVGWFHGQPGSRRDVRAFADEHLDRHGVRLGRGGGYYDRSLPLCRPDTRLVAVVRDAEVVDELPQEPHDVRVTHALTPRRGLIALADAT